MTRDMYTLTLDAFKAADSGLPDAAWRHPNPDDIESLAVLMQDAYHGTSDDDGETIEDARREVESYFAGESGTPLPDCSWLALQGRRVGSACLASLWQGVPLISYVMTAGDRKQNGLAGALLDASLACLQADGYARVRAVITAGNVPSEKLFARRGFICKEK